MAPVNTGNAGTAGNTALKIDPRRGAYAVLGLILALVLWAMTGHVPAAASAAGDVNQASCPNEALTGFSSALPDCRAYEMVTPVAKNGDRVGFEFALAGGERVGAESIGVLANATSDPDCPFSDYDLARTAEGWETSAVDDAPLDEFTYGTLECTKLLLGNDGSTLMLLRPASHSAYERDLYRQEAGSGAFVPVGPMVPASGVPPTPAGPNQQGGASDYIAATPDLSHVLFLLQPFAEAERWPGDTTATVTSNTFTVGSLYEYEGTRNSTPSLVGVNNSGELISDCGTSPGGGPKRGNRLDVMSTDGSRVFFTAVGAGDPPLPECAGVAHLPRVDELYARVSGTQTVALSEPDALSPAPPDPGCTTSECQSDISNETDFREANFEGASTDGTKVFFSSPQRLVDGATQDSDPEDGAVPANGEKGCNATSGPDGCNLYEYDFAENPQTKEPVGLVLISKADTSGVEPQVQGVAAVSEDGSHVFFVAQGVLTETPNGEGHSAVSGADNLYVNDTLTGAVSFIATLSTEDAGQWRFNGEAPMDTTADGRYLVFTSSAKLTAGDDSRVAQVFEYDSVTGTLVRVSTGDEGYDESGDAAHTGDLIERIPPSETSTQGLGAGGRDPHPAVSEDGRVVFRSDDGLAPAAFDNKCIVEAAQACSEYAQNVYEYEEGHVYLISASGGVPNPESASSISESGRDIFFESLEALAPQDPDTVADIYDAREGGGFAVAGSPLACRGEACQGAPSTPPSLTPPSSATFSGAGSFPAPLVPSPTKPKPKAKPLTRAQKLTKALHTCGQKRKKARSSCEAVARRKYAPAKKISDKRGAHS